MDAGLLRELREWFDRYTDGFLTGDEGADGPIRLKHEHTLRVCANMRSLGRSVSLSGPRMLLAEAAALFHDVGRYRQHREWGTFVDRLSVDHARLGLREMSRHRVLGPLHPDERRTVAGAVRWHNVLSVPARVTGERRRLALLLRDADKLDIWNVVTEYYRRRAVGEARSAAVELDLPDDAACSAGALSSLEQGRMVGLDDVRTLNDFKLLQIGWVYDLNFPAAFRLLRECGFLESIAATLPDTGGVRRAVDRALAYLERRAG